MNTVTVPIFYQEVEKLLVLGKLIILPLYVATTI